jgi:hypothetical protein
VAESVLVEGAQGLGSNTTNQAGFTLHQSAHIKTPACRF